jgi:hypothetical protein
VSVLKAGLGLFLIVYGAYALLMLRLPHVRGGGRLADADRLRGRRFRRVLGAMLIASGAMVVL